MTAYKLACISDLECGKILCDKFLCAGTCNIGVAPNMQLRTCVIKIVTFKGDHLMR